MEACLKAGSVVLVLRSEALVDAGKRKLMETFFFSKKLVHGKCLNTMFL